MQTVLVVDDDLLARDITKDLLENNGYNVLTAGSARDGLNILEKERVDVVLLLIDLNIREAV